MLSVNERAIGRAEIGEPPNIGRFAEDLCMRAACIEVVEHDVAIGGAADEHAGVGEREGAIGGHVDEGGRWLSWWSNIIVLGTGIGSATEAGCASN